MRRFARKGTRSKSTRRGFTLVEILVAVAIFSIVLVITLSALGETSSIWKNSASKIEAFQGARTAFELMTRNLSQATLNSYYDYDDANNPSRYLRKSDLRFVCGMPGSSLPGTAHTGHAMFFQVPVGYTGDQTKFGRMESLLNTCGYFVAFSKDPMLPPHLKGPGKYRYRLMQLLVTTETNQIFSNPTSSDSWFANYSDEQHFGSTVLPVADNIIALIVEPSDPEPGSAALAPDYAYDTAISGFEADGTQKITSNQLPPTVRLTMVAIDETSALRLENKDIAPSALINALTGKFEKTERFQKDLADLEGKLSAAGIGYRIFTSLVPIRESKWTK